MLLLLSDRYQGTEQVDLHVYLGFEDDWLSTLD